MKFSLEPSSLGKALRALWRRHPARPSRDSRLRITATAGGVALETNLSSAFLLAQVAVAGGCEVSRESVTRVVGTFVRGRPATIEARGGRLHIGRWSIEASAQFHSRENRAGTSQAKTPNPGFPRSSKSGHPWPLSASPE